MAHHYEIKRNKAGEYVACFKYNSETIFWSEGYSSIDSARSAISAIRNNAAGAEVRDSSRGAEPTIDQLIDSADWTGLGRKISQENTKKIRKKTESLLKAIIQSDADVQTKLDACKRVEAIIVLLEAPNVPWRQVADLLNHPSVTAFLTALNILQFIIGLAS
jgi:uncharacterized protein YegP (UPF0339 family)